MTVEKQREVIRLWNELRKVEGPAAEELRIQILECFSKEKPKRAACRGVLSRKILPQKSLVESNV
jgi:hypothetical protein